ncbi:MAG: hypothetical protein H6835_02255 [Planctomycetes bacterium]|nr:hypothetical protein [Planctomycetota bacterium]
MASQFARYLFVGLAVFGAATATATAQKRLKLDKKYESDAWGYEIQPIQGWNSMPADQDDRYTVGRWKFDVTDLQKRGDYEGSQKGTYCELSIIRIQPDVVTPGDGKEPEKPSNFSEAMLKKLKPKNMEEWIEANFEGASKRWLKKPFKGKMQGEIADFGTGQSHMVVATFEHLAVQWAVVYRCHEEDYNKTWSDIYEKSLKTFRVVKNVDPDAAAANRKDISKLSGDELREALHQSIAGNPGWVAIDTEHYVFLTNADRRFVESLGKDLETVRAKLYVPNFPPRNKKVPLNPVRVFKTQKEYHQFGGPGGSAGYFSPSKGELVLFQEFEGQSKTKSEDDCRSVMFHEGFHQYVHFAVGDVSPHSWFNEGHGDYFAGLNVSGSRTSVKTFDWRVDYLKQHLQGGNDLIPVRTLIRLPQREYYSNAGLKYSEGWALIYYLREITKDKEQADVLSTYFEYLADNVTAFRAKKKKDDGDDFGGESVPGIPGVRVINFEDEAKVEQILSEAVDKAFAKVDLEALDADLRKFIEKL